MIQWSDAIEAALKEKEQEIVETVKAMQALCAVKDAEIEALRDSANKVLIECDDCGNTGRWTCPKCFAVKGAQEP